MLNPVNPAELLLLLSVVLRGPLFLQNVMVLLENVGVGGVLSPVSSSRSFLGANDEFGLFQFKANERIKHQKISQKKTMSQAGKLFRSHFLPFFHI